MYDNDYLEKILGEQYNMADYFADTYTEPIVNFIDETYKIDKDSEEDSYSKNSSNVKKSELKVNDKSVEKGENKVVQESNKKNSIQLSDNNEHKIKNNDNNLKEQETEQIHQFEAVQVNADNSGEQSLDSLDKMYPEIYKMIEPIVEIIVKNYLDEDIDNNLIDVMTEKIYLAVEPEINSISVVNRGGDFAITSNLKANNNILKDLIKILIINSVLNNKQKKKKHHCPRCRNASNDISFQDVPFPEDE